MYNKSIFRHVVNKSFLMRLLLVLVSFFLAAGNVLAITWQTELVDGKHFKYSSERAIAVDSSGNPHVVYIGSQLYHTYYDGNIWHYETPISSFIPFGYHPSIAIDTSNRVHIIYWGSLDNDYNYGILYVTNASGTWEKTIVTKTNNITSSYGSLAIDNRGKAHICYYNEETLKYATNTTGSWVTTTLDNSANIDSHSIAVNSSGTVHVSYYDYSDSSKDVLKYATNASGSWVITTVESNGGHDNSISLDPSGNVHISYGSDKGLKYTTNASGSWSTKILDKSGSPTCIAIDTTGKVHIAYNGSGQKVIYATNASGSWGTTTVGYDYTPYTTNSYCSIAVDKSGNPHISYPRYPWYNEYYDDYWKFIAYATNITGSWVVTDIDKTLEVGGKNSLAVDASRKAHICYRTKTIKSDDDYEYNLRYANNVSGSWSTTIIDSSGGTLGDDHSIAVDKSGNIHCCYSIEKYLLKYATNATGTWTISTVTNVYTSEEPNNAVGDSSIAVDPQGKVHISYHDKKYGLMYATNMSGSWGTHTVDISDPEEAGNDNSIAVDTKGNVHIGHRGSLYLKYATNTSGSWITKTIDSSENIAVSGISVAVDASDKVHISYMDCNNDSLKYATNTGGFWRIMTVLSSVKGYETSITVDESGKPHIIYFTDENGLKYTFQGSVGEWVRVGVDSDVGYGSIALDSSGKVHISYCDVRNGDLKYTTNATQSTSTPTPTTTPFVCIATKISVYSSKIDLKMNESDTLTVTVSGKDNCAIDGETITANVNTRGKKVISVSPAHQITDENGQAVFTITAGNKRGNAVVTLNDGNLKKRVKVKVKK